MIIECAGHQLRISRERLCWHEVLRYDGRVVSKRRFLRGGTHVFWVMENYRETRYEVETVSLWRARIGTVRRNGRLVSCTESRRLELTSRPPLHKKRRS